LALQRLLSISLCFSHSVSFSLYVSRSLFTYIYIHIYIARALSLSLSLSLLSLFLSLSLSHTVSPSLPSFLPHSLSFSRALSINRKDINTRNKNIKSLLLSFYTLFPPLRNEGLNLKIVDSHEQAKKHDYAIYIKDLNNIWVYLNKTIKFHKPIHFNIHDEIIKTFSKDIVELFIFNILESVKLYPREVLFINNKGEQYTEKGLQMFLYELVPDKNIGINALRSMYTSFFLPKLNKNQINRVAFLMRTSCNMLSTNYLKKMKKMKKQI
jgi:hypothetical protein